MSSTQLRTIMLMLGCLIMAVSWLAVRTPSSPPANLTEVMGDDVSRVAQLLIRDGNTGNAITLEQPDSMQPLLDFLINLELTAQARKASAGWSYCFDLYITTIDYWHLTLAGERLTLSYVTSQPYQVHGEQSYSIPADAINFLHQFYATLEDRVTAGTSL